MHRAVLVLVVCLLCRGCWLMLDSPKNELIIARSWCRGHFPLQFDYRLYICLVHYAPYAISRPLEVLLYACSIIIR
jgi:hypothetical protein